MGLIKAAKDAVSSMLADQWREYFYCDSLSNDILAAKGRKRQSGGRNSNKGGDNIISNGSIIAVNEGQCMMIVEQGGIAEFCAEAGEFVYDNSTEPSLFYGDLGERAPSRRSASASASAAARARTRGSISSIPRRSWTTVTARPRPSPSAT